MYTFLVALLVVDAFFLGIVILLQAGKGGGLAAMGGGAAATEGILAGRQATSMLTRATWTGGGLFMGLALVLSIMSSRAQQPSSILQQDFQQAPVAPVGEPQPVLPGAGATDAPDAGASEAPGAGATDAPAGDVPPGGN